MNQGIWTREKGKKEEQLWYQSNILIFSLKPESKHFMTCQIFLSFVILSILDNYFVTDG